MDSKFNIGDLVVYEKQVYIVNKIIPMLTNIPSEPFVYGLKLNDSSKDVFPDVQILVREGLLSPLAKAHKVLYG